MKPVSPIDLLFQAALRGAAREISALAHGMNGAPPPATATPLAPRPDPYRVLGLPRGCSAAEVRKRVRELAKVFHPDRGRAGDAEKMAEINAAADAIGDKK